MASAGPRGLRAGDGAGRGGGGAGVSWQRDPAGHWSRRLEAAAAAAAAAHSETAPKGAEGQPATSSWPTSPAKGPRNQQQLHRELLFTHRKGLSLRSKPELLQVLEHRNRRRDGEESGVEQSSLEQELLRRQQRREQNQQQEETGDMAGNQPEFIQVRENLRRTHYPREPPPLRAAPSPISSTFLRPHLTNRQPFRISATRSSVVPKPPAPQIQGSLKGSSHSSAPLAKT